MPIYMKIYDSYFGIYVDVHFLMKESDKHKVHEMVTFIWLMEATQLT